MDHVVHGDGHGGVVAQHDHAQGVAHQDDLAVALVHDGGGLGCEVDELLDGTTGLGLAARLQVLAHRDERENRARALEVEVVHGGHVCGVEPRGRACGKLVGHEEHCVDRPSDARRGADSDERVHGGAAVCQ